MRPTETFNPGDVATWLSRGRRPEHAEALAAAWRDHPDLPHDAPLADRQARFRERVAAMRPVNEAIAAQLEAETQAKNFAFVEARQRDGNANEGDLAILVGRDRYGYDWHLCHRYADGWYAAHVGWPHRYSEAFPSRAPLAVRHAAYDQGFSDGGGDRTDLFDAARRTYLAQYRQDNTPAANAPAAPGRPLPSDWPKPSDAPRPARWPRRLAIISDADISNNDLERGAWDFLQLIRDRPGARDATILILTHAGFVQASEYNPIAQQEGPRQVDPAAASQQLHDALAGREFDDVLVGLKGADLDLLDRVAAMLPLCRTMERTRNTELQRRAHLKLWLDRGYAANQAMGAGHIRWGKVIHGHIGKLGEFTARYAGPAPAGGHLVRVEFNDGQLAHGYAAADGSPMPPEIVVASKARLRSAIATALRSFSAATQLMGACQGTLPELTGLAA